ncbi:hypothetical protein [Aureimonas psammosilenae]|uniref:hypothetical protein n=1 Tax=Aureimonas psammosilenae TaxID=2495496 RepID=UPI001260BC3E|nr:hypothetical protein [Aureimonas psammosilenae]
MEMTTAEIDAADAVEMARKFDPGSVVAGIFLRRKLNREARPIPIELHAELLDAAWDQINAMVADQEDVKGCEEARLLLVDAVKRICSVARSLRH